jgi:autotransporter-associated beta strand protein
MALSSVPSRLVAALLALPALAVAQTNYVWTGNNATVSGNSGFAYALEASNWQGNVTPTSNGTTNGSVLTFGATGNITSGTVSLFIQPINVAGVNFTGAFPSYSLSGLTYPTVVGLGSAGLNVGSSGSELVIYSGVNVNLLANQTWTLNSAVYVYGDLTEANPGTTLTKTGFGDLVLSSPASTFSGGFNLQQGTLYLGASSAGAANQPSGSPVGTGILTLGDGTSLRSFAYGDLTLHNAINLGTDVTIGAADDYYGFELAGDITLNRTATTLRVGTDEALMISGSIRNGSGGASQLTVAGSASKYTVASNSTNTQADDFRPIAVLMGNNTYTGGTTVDGAGVVFFSPDALPATGTLSAVNRGYFGTGYSGGAAAIIAKVADPSAFDGSIGFDTNPDLSSVPTEFSDTLDLRAFAPDTGSPTAGFWGLGTLTFAKLTNNSTITPPNGGNYVFGGGDGTLYVATNLGVPSGSPTAGVRVRSDFGDKPLTVYLQGNNTFAGNVMSDHSIVILDSPGALPTTANFSMDSEAYVGFTENTGWTPAQFIARLHPGSYNSNSVLGFDHAPENTSHGRNIGFTSLAGLSDVYLGTTTHVHFTEGIRAPSSGNLSVTGLKGGWLNLDGALTPTYASGNSTVSGVDRLLVGLNGVNELYDYSYVEVTNANNTFTGGTTLANGVLILGASSVVSGNTLVSGPLGTGTFTLAGDSYDYRPPIVVAGTASVTLRNDLAFAGRSNVQFGVTPSFNDEDINAKVQAYQGNQLTLTGNLSGSSSGVRFVGNTTFTLSGNNSAFHADRIEIGSYYNYGGTRVVATHANALGDSTTALVLQPGSDLQFVGNATTFRVGAFYTEDDFYTEGDKSFVALPDGSTLVINQFLNGTLRASLGGTPGDWTTGSPTASTAALVKNGTGTLRLAQDNNLSGGLTVNAGAVHFTNQSSTNVGNITLNGGRVSTGSGVTLGNNLTFGSSGGTIGGNGTFTMPITVTANVTLAPGSSPGTTTFANDLTFASGGTYLWEIQGNSTANSFNTDFVNVTGNLIVTAGASTPFTIRLSTLDDSGNQGALSSWNPGTTYSWTLLSANTITGYASDKFVLDTSQFASPLNGGTFSLMNNTNSLVLSFTPVPEPSTYALLALGLGAVGFQLRRRRRS